MAESAHPIDMAEHTSPLIHHVLNEDPAIRQAVESLLDICENVLDPTSYSHHRDKMFGEFAWARSVLTGVPALVGHGPECSDCKRFPQPTQRPVSEEEWAGHKIAYDVEVEPRVRLRWTCECGESGYGGDPAPSDHVVALRGTQH